MSTKLNSGSKSISAGLKAMIITGAIIALIGTGFVVTNRQDDVRAVAVKSSEAIASTSNAASSNNSPAPTVSPSRTTVPSGEQDDAPVLVVSQSRMLPSGEQEFILVGQIVGRPHPVKKNVVIYDFHYGVEGKKVRASGPKGRTAEDIDYRDYVDTYVRMTAHGEPGERGLELSKIYKVEALDNAELKAYLDLIQAAKVRKFDPSPNALAFSGQWGVRMSLPSAKQAKDVQKFDPEVFAKQLSQLQTASYVMVNVTHPADPCYFTGPNPSVSEACAELAKSFPKRDILGEALEAIAKSGKMALVYFAAEGYTNKATEEQKIAWQAYIEGRGMHNDEAVAKFIVAHYANKHGKLIHGWWFDGSGGLNQQERLQWRQIVREGNPKAVITFNRMAGAPYRSTPECDYFGGHPTPRSQKSFWDEANLAMIEAIEAGAWMDTEGNPVKSPSLGAVGHVFMGMQERWNFGKCEFPPEQAMQWTTRVLSSGGMYTWHGPRNGSGIANGQFQLLLKIDQAVAKMRGQK